MPRDLLFDSNFLIDLERGYRPVVRFTSAAREDRWSISMITYGEFLQGALWAENREKALEAFERIVRDFETLAISLDVIKQYAHLKGLLERQGRSIGTADLIIAATALEHNQILVTRNVRHFSRIHDLLILDPSALVD